MKTTRRTFLESGGLAAAAVQTPAQPPAQSLNPLAAARRNRIVREGPTPNFFEGMLMGNGDIGVCVTVRPDALGLHIGKEDSWDIRVSEDHYAHVVKFKELLEMWKRAGEEAKAQGKPDMLFLDSNIPWFREYTDRVQSSYRKSWPRPWPCGIVWIHWDARSIRVARQELDISTGLLTITLEHDNLSGTVRTFRVFVSVSQDSGHISVRSDAPAPFASIAYYPNIDDSAKLPRPELASRVEAGFGEFTCYQHFPAIAPTDEQPDPPRSDKDSNFALCGRLAGEWRREGEEGTRVFLRAGKQQPFRLDVALYTPRDHRDNVAHAAAEAARLTAVPSAQLERATAAWWARFWSKSAVEFEERELERIWYHNQYWLACCLKEGKVAPGLFGNWTSGRIGTAWHGDYHMNYNTQQVFWGVFSSNHVEQHLPYVDLCEKLLPLSERYAKEKFELPGAFFPHSAYPVPSQTIAYPAPPWGYEICETPWTVQSLWWQYLYTLDKDFLKRAYPLLRAASRFLAAFVSKAEDGKYHIVPTVSPENWGFTVDFRLNKDCIIDLALSEFVLRATAEAARLLGEDEGERGKWAEIARDMAPYPTAKGPYGEVWTDIVNSPAEYVYNVPVTLAPVFPGEQVGLGARPEMLAIARRSARTLRLEGGNDIVYQPMIRARLGMLDLDWFRREVRYSTMPNGIVQDRCRQIDGRYRDQGDFDFMMRMGVWTENLSLPGVLNECMLQSYTGVLRLFPNTRRLGRARFENLRAAGAFLVSAAWDGTAVSPFTILSEKGATARIACPWKQGAKVTRFDDGSAIQTRREGELLSFETQAGRKYRIEPAG
jgi:alpha-L-fucosidase 2